MGEEPPEFTDTTPLLLAGGRVVLFDGDPRDLSVFAAIKAQNGEWEPHVRRCLENLVKPGFVCLDIGANLGAHSLSLAALATNGRVICFEASPRNYNLLRRNVARLDGEGARVDLVHAALWDSPGTLEIAAVDELAGCSFISPNRDAADSETAIRRVVDEGAIKDVALHVHHDRIPAMRLDDWVETARPERVDLIKIDVEGAEGRVLSGARRMLRRFRPILITEYNPACAVQYFDQSASAYFEILRGIFADIRIIEADGSLSEALSEWTALRTRLEAGRGWEDLLCIPNSDKNWLRGLWNRLLR